MPPATNRAPGWQNDVPPHRLPPRGRRSLRRPSASTTEQVPATVGMHHELSRPQPQWSARPVRGRPPAGGGPGSRPPTEDDDRGKGRPHVPAVDADEPRRHDRAPHRRPRAGDRAPLSSGTAGSPTCTFSSTSRRRGRPPNGRTPSSVSPRRRAWHPCNAVLGSAPRSLRQPWRGPARGKLLALARADRPRRDRGRRARTCLRRDDPRGVPRGWSPPRAASDGRSGDRSAVGANVGDVRQRSATGRCDDAGVHRGAATGGARSRERRLHDQALPGRGRTGGR